MKRVILLIISILSLSSVVRAQEGEKSLKLWHQFHLDLGIGMNFNQHHRLTGGNAVIDRWLNVHSAIGYRGTFVHIETSFDRPAYKILYPRKPWRQLAISGSANILPLFDRKIARSFFIGPTLIYGKNSGLHTTTPNGALSFPNLVSGYGATFSCKVKGEQRVVLTYHRVKFTEDDVHSYTGYVYQYKNVTHTITASFSLTSAIFKKKKTKP